jgi:hypothetical protein
MGEYAQLPTAWAFLLSAGGACLAVATLLVVVLA